MTESNASPRVGILDRLARRSTWLINLASGLAVLAVVMVGYYWPIGVQTYTREDLPDITHGHVRKRFIEYGADRVDASLNKGFFGLREAVLDGKLAAYIEVGGEPVKVFECNFENGVLVGMLREWSSQTGQLTREVEYSNSDGSAAISRTWHEDGSIRSETWRKPGGFTMESKRWSRDGELIMHRKRIDGKLETLLSNPPAEEMPAWLNEGLILRSEDGPPE